MNLHEKYDIPELQIIMSLYHLTPSQAPAVSSYQTNLCSYSLQYLLLQCLHLSLCSIITLQTASNPLLTQSHAVGPSIAAGQDSGGYGEGQYDYMQSEPPAQQQSYPDQLAPTMFTPGLDLALQPLTMGVSHQP